MQVFPKPTASTKLKYFLTSNPQVQPRDHLHLVADADRTDSDYSVEAPAAVEVVANLAAHHYQHTADVGSIASCSVAVGSGSEAERSTAGEQEVIAWEEPRTGWDCSLPFVDMGKELGPEIACCHSEADSEV